MNPVLPFLAIDPGLDVTGWAAWQPGALPSTLDEAMGALRAAGEICTSPADPDALRLASIADQLSQLLADYAPAVAYVELPAIEGSYTGGKERRRGVNRLYMAIGTILSHLAQAGVHVHGLPAIRTPKPVRHELLRHAAGMAGVGLPEGPRGGAREDVWDAIWLGAAALLERGRRDLEEPAA